MISVYACANLYAGHCLCHLFYNICSNISTSLGPVWLSWVDLPSRKECILSYSPSSLNSSKAPTWCIKFCFSAGSRDESFFDTHAWLESDCEDDFYSVNGGKISITIHLLQNLHQNLTILELAHLQLAFDFIPRL